MDAPRPSGIVVESDATGTTDSTDSEEAYEAMKKGSIRVVRLIKQLIIRSI